jgi:hypothetical protein
VECYQQWKTPDSSTTALCQLNQQCYLVAKQVEHGEVNAGFFLRYISFILVWFFNVSSNVTTWDLQLCFPSEGSPVTGFFISLKNLSSSGFEPTKLWYSGKHAITRPPTATTFILQFSDGRPYIDIGT